MKSVFCITIHYHDNSVSRINVAATDDLKARAAALVEDARSYKDQHIKPPKVEYCEATFIGKAIRT